MVEVQRQRHARWRRRRRPCPQLRVEGVVDAEAESHPDDRHHQNLQRRRESKAAGHRKYARSVKVRRYMIGITARNAITAELTATMPQRIAGEPDRHARSIFSTMPNSERRWFEVTTASAAPIG